MGAIATLSVGFAVEQPPRDGTNSNFENFEQESDTSNENLLLENETIKTLVESQDVGQTLDESAAAPDEPTLTVYEPRILEEADLVGDISTNEVTASFPLPSGCAASADRASLSCPSGQIAFSSTIVDAAGTLLSAEVGVDADFLYLTTTPPGDAQFPVIFTAYLTDVSTPEVLEDAEDALAWMVAQDDSDGLSQEELEREERLLNDAVATGMHDPSDDPYGVHNSKSEVSAAALLNTPGSGLLTVVPVASSRPFKVQIPEGYRHCPSWCTPKARHDYCTSPAVNAWATRQGAADFRGPCARHDMMISGIAKKSISRDSKRSQRATGDKVFLVQLQQNCRHGFYKTSQLTGKASCFTATAGYYAAVSVTTRRWDGK